MAAPQAMLNTAELLAELNIGRHTLYRLQKDKNTNFPAAYMVGATQRWKREDIDQWLETRQRAS